MRKWVVALMVQFAFAASVQANGVVSDVLRIVAPDGRKIIVHAEDISHVQPDDSAGTSQVTFSVSDPLASQFAELSAENIGNQIAIYVCGEEVSNPVVRSPIAGGWWALAGLERGMATEVADVLSGRKPCD